MRRCTRELTSWMEHGALLHHRQEGEFDGTHATEIQRDKVVPQRRGMSHSIRRKWATERKGYPPQGRREAERRKSCRSHAHSRASIRDLPCPCRGPPGPKRVLERLATCHASSATRRSLAQRRSAGCRRGR